MTVSTHVLDAMAGRPAGGVAVSLARLDPVNEQWEAVAAGETDADGRHRFGVDVAAGVYQLTFGTGEYFAARAISTFYPFVTIMFSVGDPDGHYHVPLLLSPFGYSTYRGSLAERMTDMAFELTEQIERHLIGDQIVWLTTVTPSGWPAPRPVWFVWDGSAVTIYSLNTGVKQRHIAVNNKVTLSFDAGPGGGDIVVISGRAGVVPDAPPPSRFPGLLDKYAPAIEYMGRTPQWYDDEYGVALRVIPERAWSVP